MSDPVDHDLPEEIESQEADSGVSGAAEGFDPVALMPKDTPATKVSRWTRLGKDAGSRYRAAVELKCIDCCGWERSEAARCEIRTCALWALNRKIFG